MAIRPLETFEPIAVGDVQDYDIDFTPYITGSGESPSAGHAIDSCTADTGITLVSSTINNGVVLNGVNSSFVKVNMQATQAGTFTITARIITAAGRKHTASVKVKVA